jgi:hypothetical protein
MPRGTRHIITGTLLPGIGHLYFLEVIGGGSWQLDMCRRNDRLIGHLVTVEGIRSGFDLLDVERIWTGDIPPDRPAPLKNWRERLRKIRNRA